MVRRSLKIFHQYFTLSSEIKEFGGRWERKMGCSQHSVRIHLHLTSKTHSLSTTPTHRKKKKSKAKAWKIMNLKTDTSTSAFQSLYLLFRNAWPKNSPSDLIEKDSEGKGRRRGLPEWSSNPVLGNPVTRSWSALCVYSRQSPTLISGLNLRAAGFPERVQKQKPTGHNLLEDNKNRKNTSVCLYNIPPNLTL